VRALITGGGGQLASDLRDLLGDDARAYSHAELDIADSAALDRAFEETGPTSSSTVRRSTTSTRARPTRTPPGP